MRYLLPAMLAVVALIAGSSPAPAMQPARHTNERVDSHISLHVSRHNVLSGHRVVLRGRVRAPSALRVKVVVRGPDGALLGSYGKPSGAFRLSWTPRGAGSYKLRAFGIHSRRATGSASAARRVTAYRSAAASYYGPGLYGGALACGGTLQPGTLGVANKTLACGSKVKLRYRGRNITVRVVDRGPYVAGRDFDLTAATKARLGFPDTGVLLSSR
jgi:hypothetical protein